MTDTENTFNYHDDLTADVTADSQPLETDPLTIDWNDPSDVTSAASYLSDQIENALRDYVQQIQAQMPEQNVNTAVLVTTALTYAANRWNDRFIPTLLSAFTAKGDTPDWVPALLGYENWHDLLEDNPELEELTNARLEAKKTGEPVTVVLDDCDCEVVVREDDRGMSTEINCIQ